MTIYNLDIEEIVPDAALIQWRAVGSDTTHMENETWVSQWPYYGST